MVLIARVSALPIGDLPVIRAIADRYDLVDYQGIFIRQIGSSASGQSAQLYNLPDLRQGKFGSHAAASRVRSDKQMRPPFSYIIELKLASMNLPDSDWLLYHDKLCAPGYGCVIKLSLLLLFFVVITVI